MPIGRARIDVHHRTVDSGQRFEALFQSLAFVTPDHDDAEVHGNVSLRLIWLSICLRGTQAISLYKQHQPFEASIFSGAARAKNTA
jgi:hypothetical protein